MSGIVGIFNKDGAPADRGLLQALARFLAYRGPDGREVWVHDAVGFGHTMLRTTRESLNERQPTGLDGRFWITADARIDCRAELRAELESAGRKTSRTTADPDLILHAYAAWKEECVQHLRGDFSFAIWDIRDKKLFCARDHFGIKPFYYAEIGNTFIFSNTLNCVRLHPSVPDELNDAAILDFLLAGLNCDNATTTFRDVRRLPPAHSLAISAEGSRVKRYWEPPIDGRIRYRREEEYVEHFQGLLKEAVADRMRTERMGIFLSGGLDSSAIAATARELMAASAERADLRAYTSVYESLIPDSEGSFAKKVAGHLRIPIRVLALDNVKPFERWDDAKMAWPEPVEDPFFADLFDGFQMIGGDCRAVLNGEGNDALMSFQMAPYARDLWRQREWGQLLTCTSGFLRVRRLPWRGALARGRRIFGKGPLATVLPKWVSTRLAGPQQMKERWAETRRLTDGRRHPVVPQAHASLHLPQWTHLFETNDPGLTRFPIEVRYPFLDLRIVDYLLAIPPFPWFYEKQLLRRAMTGHLPADILSRPKTPLAGDPLVAQLQRPETAWIDQVQWDEEIDRYIDRSEVPKLAGEGSPAKALAGIRPYCLNFWLQFARRVRYNLIAEVRNG
ncbi:MAG TPA: asparagine synthase-related protein [Candidatus Acidoferrales bacterium]|nr:asparagine synthase-related protein [Candidatus Acidoferrales bacterium]